MQTLPQDLADAGLAGTAADTPARVQDALARRHARHGLADALDLLFAWCGA